MHAGQALSYAVTAHDCLDRVITISATGLPSDATLVNSLDSQLQMYKASVVWTPAASTPVESFPVIFTASVDASTATGTTPVSVSKTVTVNVLPPVDSGISQGVVASNTIASARFNSYTKKLVVSGKVIWSSTSTKADRTAAIANGKNVITNAVTGSQLGAATVSITGTWTVAIPASRSTLPCSVDASFDGVIGVKSVYGALNCTN